jgi:hypothetical protein
MRCAIGAPLSYGKPRQRTLFRRTTRLEGVNAMTEATIPRFSHAAQQTQQWVNELA